MTDSRRRALSRDDIRQKLKQFGIPGTVRPVVDFPSSRHKLRRVLPFQRSWKLILAIAIIDGLLMIPAVMTFDDAMDHWRHLDSLFDLTSAIFLTAWVIGWSLAPLLATAVLLLVSFGREVLIGRPGILQLGIGMPGLVLFADFEAIKIQNLRLSDSDEQAGTGWRGTHITFDYDDRPIHFGSAMTPGDLAELSREITSATWGMPPISDAVVRADKVPQAFYSQGTTDPGIDEASKPVSITSWSTLILIASNLVPLVGAFYFGWRLGDIMVLYWAESAVVALYNLAKMAYVGKWAALLMGVFFLAHFGAFMAVHFLFIYGLFIEWVNQSTAGDLQEVAQLFISLWPALLALVVSHGVSFFSNFIGNREYQEVTVKQLMAAPYSRIVLMHLTLIFGGFITMMLGDAGPVLILFILIKIVMDVKAHLKEHKKVGRLGSMPLS